LSFARKTTTRNPFEWHPRGCSLQYRARRGHRLPGRGRLRVIDYIKDNALMSTVEQQSKPSLPSSWASSRNKSRTMLVRGRSGADSLDTVELVMALEEEFEIEIPDEDAEKITTSSRPSSTSTIAVPKPDRSASWGVRPGFDRGRSVIVHPGRVHSFSIQVACEQASRRRHWPRHHFARRQHR